MFGEGEGKGKKQPKSEQDKTQPQNSLLNKENRRIKHLRVLSFMLLLPKSIKTLAYDGFMPQ
jgi:hypothetical protein